jgi:uncharacterized damage-inducible protein DinB
MNNRTIINEYIRELEAEAAATRKCLERIPDSLYDWKPHEKSMNMGYLTLLVGDIPRWIKYMIEESVIDFATFPQFKLSNTEALVAHFDENMAGAKKALEGITDDALSQVFSLRNSGQVLYSSPLSESIGSTINHMVHHRGQLTVYMRLNDIAVPSIYGPSADEKGF